ncbi:uncharacterized protein EURHEDRAFT_382226 [Aspergillus ruber CBS 135680]|uniref:Uncharacterized protein n=1 Tax=Aspergillus ruber (strain CBS 135680) TaxID=1388766 RepID=A0A017RZR3_ASPRC|nr:uncharacterized protein EURHEDRAFT_382226 [Aspergillus ruber CBS 135680]EYE90167.1 hypothetical protein EURHEDRAFT_382226 [Aspergillus ruber CBS 135680]
MADPNPNYPTPSTPIQAIGLREICQVNNHHFRRLRGTDTWIEYTPQLTSTSTAQESKSVQSEKESVSPIYLSISLESQTPTEPNHWSLFLARENAPGKLYQVTGDAESMAYEPSVQAVDITRAENFYTLYQLVEVSEEQAGIVREIAEGEMPPKAENRAAVRENCQGWCVRVLGRLAGRGIVGREKVEMAKGLMEPV